MSSPPLPSGAAAAVSLSERAANIDGGSRNSVPASSPNGSHEQPAADVTDFAGAASSSGAEGFTPKDIAAPSSSGTGSDRGKSRDVFYGT